MSRFEIAITAEPEDIDELGHVSNLVYLRWVLDVATAHSLDVGFDHDAYRELGSIWVVRRHELDYLRSAVEGQCIRLTTWVDSWKQASCVRKTEIACADTDEVLARAATTWALISFETNRPTRIPPQLRATFE